MLAMRVLVVEDDQPLANLVTRMLRKDGMQADVTHDGASGLEMALSGTYDVAVVDWMLPGRDGPSICRAVRQAKLRLPVLMLTARDQVEDRVAGLFSGADDYLTKPFALEELKARIFALSRRFDIATPDGQQLQCGQLVLNLHMHTATRDGVPLDLTLTEWNLLEYLMRNQGQALTRDQIFARVWAYDSDAQLKMVDIYISYLRRKLKVTPDAPELIETVRGVGYKLM